jgi:UDP-N-acetylmuramoyl-L-alanyl-D-glutamate--2,6-diaminopimelate ligase
MILFSQVLQTLGFFCTPCADFSLDGLTLSTDGLGRSTLFWACQGQQHSAQWVVQAAIQAGAKVIIWDGVGWDTPEKNIIQQGPCWIVTLPDKDLFLPALCQLFYPLRPPCKIAVTGTNGKTSVVHFLSEFWQITGKRWTTLGTLGCRTNGDFFLPHRALTTPDRLSIAQGLHKSAQAQVEFFALEASSHSLVQDRLEGLRFDLGIWTSFSQDHLDYHRDMTSYWQAKARLLSLVDGPFLIHDQVQDLDKLRATVFEKQTPETKILIYGMKPPAVAGTHENLWAFYQKQKPVPGGWEVLLSIGPYQWTGIMTFMADFQYENLLAALAAFYKMGGDLLRIFDHLPSLKSPPGRLEYAGCSPQGGYVYIDYAHTPQALERSLQALRSHFHGKIGLVFGCGGQRDAHKRPLMGQVAQTYADWVIITDDNPRSEDPSSIHQAIQRGCPKGCIILDRAQAIAQGIGLLGPEDVLLVAGKGHENTQTIGHQVLPFSDLEVVRACLAQPKSFS